MSLNKTFLFTSMDTLIEASKKIKEAELNKEKKIKQAEEHKKNPQFLKENVKAKGIENESQDIPPKEIMEQIPKKKRTTTTHGK